MRHAWTSRKARRRIRRELRGKRFLPGLYSRINLPDRRFDLMSLADVHELLDWAGVFRFQFQDERFDCDNFAKSLSARSAEWAAPRADYKNAPAFGHLWGNIDGRGHAVNWVILDTGRLWLVEPQQQRKIWRPRRGLDRRITLIET